MALDKPYTDVPGTTIFDAEQSRKGYHLNQFCMSLMKAENRERFKTDERAYLDAWPMTEEQKQGVLTRDLNRCIAAGGNIYFLAKIGATDGKSFQQMAGSMTGMTEAEYRHTVLSGGRSAEGHRVVVGRCSVIDRHHVVQTETAVQLAALHDVVQMARATQAVVAGDVLLAMLSAPEEWEHDQQDMGQAPPIWMMPAFTWPASGSTLAVSRLRSRMVLSQARKRMPCAANSFTFACTILRSLISMSIPGP